MLRIAFLAIALTLSAPAQADITGTASVIDGDTIEVHGQRIRFHGIDAPESRKADIAPFNLRLPTPELIHAHERIGVVEFELAPQG